MGKIENPELMLSRALQLKPTDAKNLTKFTGLTEDQILNLNEQECSFENSSKYISDWGFGRVVGISKWENLDQDTRTARWHNFLKNKGNVAFWAGIAESTYKYMEENR